MQRRTQPEHCRCFLWHCWWNYNVAVHANPRKNKISQKRCFYYHLAHQFYVILRRRLKCCLWRSRIFLLVLHWDCFCVFYKINTHHNQIPSCLLSQLHLLRIHLALVYQNHYFLCPVDVGTYQDQRANQSKLALASQKLLYSELCLFFLIFIEKHSFSFIHFPEIWTQPL